MKKYSKTSEIPDYILRAAVSIVHAFFSVDDLVGFIEQAAGNGPHGASYWCDFGKGPGFEFNRKPDGYPGKSRLFAVLMSPTNGIIVTEDIDGDSCGRHYVRADTLIQGLARMLILDPQTFAQFMEDNADAPAADRLLQWALLGEQRYG